MIDLVRKLHLKPGMRILVIDGPEDFLNELSTNELSVETNPASTSNDVVVLFAGNRRAAESGLPNLVASTKTGGSAWLAYRKVPGGDLNRAGVWAIVEPAGWVPVSQFAIDNVWSALRIRPLAEVRI